MIEFDPEKDRTSRHRLPFAFAAEIFEGRYVEYEDTRFDYGETRFIAIGSVASIGALICSTVYTWRGAKRRIISFRRASDRELGKYGGGDA